MLHFTTKPLRFLPLIALAAGMLTTALYSSASRADSPGDKKVGDIRLGVYYSGSSGIRQTFTSTVASAGLDYIVGETVGISRSVIGVDYMQRGGGGSSLQIIPVTISEQYYHTLGGTGVTPYGEAGVGGYFVKINDQNHENLTSSHSETALGGFIGGGIDLNSSLFLDLRYHLIGTIKGDDPSGYEFTAGIRF
jgi:hypothetical protein